MSNNTVKIILQYNNKTTSVELVTPRHMRTFLKVLWDAMEAPPIRFANETPQINIDPDFLRSPEVLDGSYKFACPFDCKDHKNCPDHLPNGKCSFGRHTSEQLAVAPQCPVATDKPAEANVAVERECPYERTTKTHCPALVGGKCYADVAENDGQIETCVFNTTATSDTEAK